MSTNTQLKRSVRVPFWAQILIGLALGVLLGWLARSQDLSWLVTTLEKVGGTFVGLLKLAVAPLVFFAILVSITNLRKVNNAARLASRTLLWFMITSLIAVAIGLVIGLVTNPGAGTGLTPADGAEPEHTGSWIDFLTGIVPTDVITPFTELNVLQIVFMAAVAASPPSSSARRPSRSSPSASPSWSCSRRPCGGSSAWPRSAPPASSATPSPPTAGT